MGMDIYEGSGVVFTAADIVKRLCGKFSKTKTKAVVSVLREILSASKNDIGELHYPNAAGALDTLITGRDLPDWFEAFLREGLTDSYGDFYYSDDTVLHQVWDALVVVAAGLSLPSVSFEYWTRPRISGWEVPIEVPCVVFEDADLFETKMTKKGQELAKLCKLKTIEKTTWTVMSV